MECDVCALCDLTDDKVLTCVLSEEECCMFTDNMLRDDVGRILEMDYNSLHQTDYCIRLSTNFNMLVSIDISKASIATLETLHQTDDTVPKINSNLRLSTLENPRDYCFKRVLIKSGYAGSKGAIVNSQESGTMQVAIESVGGVKLLNHHL